MAEDQTKLRKRLEALLKLPDNQFCVDCKKKGKENTELIAELIYLLSSP